MKNIIPIIIVSLFLFGCKAEEDEATSSTTELEGSWKTACYTNSDNTSYYDTLKFAGNTVTVTGEKHSDTSCATDYRTDVESHTFAVGDAGKFTVTIGSTFQKTPKSSSAVSNYNTNSKCGHSDWELNVAKSCSNGNDAGSTVYGIYEISDTTLYIDVGSSYASSLSKTTSSTFTKQ